VRAKREHHGPVRVPSCLLEAVFMWMSTLSLLRIHFTTYKVPWGKDMHHILLSWPQYYKATARTARAKRVHHGPAGLPSCLLEAVFM
jgi:hypothetical protein